MNFLFLVLRCISIKKILEILAATLSDNLIHEIINFVVDSL